MSKLTEKMINKYQSFINNLEWHLKTNQPTESEVYFIKTRIGMYKEFIYDINIISNQDVETSLMLTDYTRLWEQEVRIADMQEYILKLQNTNNQK